MGDAVYVRRLGTPGRVLLDGARDVGGLVELDDLGRGSLTLAVDDHRVLADPDLLGDGVQVDVTRGHQRWAWLVDDEGGDRIVAGQATPGPLRLSGPGPLALLDEAEVRPFPFLQLDSPDFRAFGWQAPDYDDSGWVSPAPYSGGQQRDPVASVLRGQPEGWPDPLAEWIWTRNVDGTGSHPVGTCYFRRTLDVAAKPAAAGKALIYVTGDNSYVCYFDGAPVAAGDDWTRYQTAAIELVEGRQHQLAVQVTNDPKTSGPNPGGLLLTIVQLDADGDPTSVLFRSFTPAVYGGPGAPEDWRVLDYPASTPGVTWGTIFGTLGGEGQDREAGEHLWWTFTGTDDSAGIPWVDEVAFTWPVGMSLLDVARVAVEFGIHVEVTPDLELRLVQSRGVDRTVGAGPVQLLEGRDIVASRYERAGVRANVLSVRAEDGWHERANDLSVATYRRREGTLEVGGAQTADDIDAVVVGILDRDGNPRRQATITVIDHPDGPTFGRDYDLADWIHTPHRVTGRPVRSRIISWAPAGTADDGRHRWTLTVLQDGTP